MTERLTDEALAELLACVENLLAERMPVRGMTVPRSGAILDYKRAATPEAVAALVREVRESRARVAELEADTLRKAGDVDHWRDKYQNELDKHAQTAQAWKAALDRTASERDAAQRQAREARDAALEEAALSVDANAQSALAAMKKVDTSKPMGVAMYGRWEQASDALYVAAEGIRDLMSKPTD